MELRRHGKHLRRRSGARVALVAVFAAVLLLCALCFGGALSRLDSLIDADFFGAALAHEYPAAVARAPTLLESVIGPAIALVPVDDAPTSAPTAAPSTAPTHAPRRDASPAPSIEPTPSREPNAADLDPNVRTVTVAPNSTDGYDFFDGVYVKNGTSCDVDVRSYLEATPEFDGVPHILIVHTHASEAYYPEGEDSYEPTDVERTEDTNFNVVRVGDELERILTERGYAVTHVREIFDYPTYNGSYTRTLEAIERALADDDGIQLVIDLHRDAIEGADGSTWRTVCDVDGRLAAQSMLVVGSDEGGLKHPKWRQNLMLAIHLQKYFVDRHPALMRPIALSPSRYNQHATTGSLILEVGTSGNTLDEALYSVQLIGGMTCDFLDELCG